MYAKHQWAAGHCYRFHGLPTSGLDAGLLWNELVIEMKKSLNLFSLGWGQGGCG